MALLPFDHFSQERFRKSLISYEIVVDEENFPDTKREQGVELG